MRRPSSLWAAAWQASAAAGGRTWQTETASPGSPLLAFYTVLLFLSALLLFWLQPLFGKLALPYFGGAPAVWNTAMVFFQVCLLAGYSYAHLSVRWLGPRAQSRAHLVVLVAGILTLPLTISPDFRPAGDVAPSLTLLALMAVTAGPPFFVLSTSAPLLQRWFAETGHARAANPYPLYAASNLGSLLALLGFPVLLEPLLSLPRQGSVFTVLYIALGLMIAIASALLRRPSAPGAIGEVLPEEPPPGWRQRLHWLALAAVPSSLLLGVTQHITTDVAAVPFLWVLPLALYLTSFVIVFSSRPLLGRDTMLLLQPFAVLPLAIVFYWQIKSLWLVLLIHLMAFFVLAMVCHGELARRRPHPRYLTEFYFWMSLGGALGGALTALAAPLLFERVWEYPLALVLALWLRPAGKAGTAWPNRLLDLALPAVLAAVLLAPSLVPGFKLGESGPGGLAVLVGFFAAATGAVYAFRNRPLRFALGIATLLLGGLVSADIDRYVRYRERSFFGVHEVQHDATGRFRVLMHGTTIHGAQHIDEARRREPLTYYVREGPFAQILETLRARNPQLEMAVVGLGAGNLACYRRPEDQLSFFEIDPAVERIARDQRFFTFLADCAPQARVVLGDARLSLRAEPSARFDLIVLDAFSSDAIPVHLLTREALALYLDKLAPGGVLAVHISNWYMRLEPVLAALADDAGLKARMRHFSASPRQQAEEYKFSATWVALTRAQATLDGVAPDGAWKPLARRDDVGPWTDSFSNVFRVLRWQRAG